MIELREAVSDADLEDWIRVRRTVVPNESAGTVDLIRAQNGPERLLLLAQLDGEVAGSGLSDRSDIGDRFALRPRVLLCARRRGVGTALIRGLNERLGYVYRDESVTMLAPLPLPLP